MTDRIGSGAASARAGPASAAALLCAPGTADHEFEFTAEDFERIKRLIHRRAGIALGPAKQTMVYSRLSRRLRARGDRRFVDYLDHLEASARDPEWELFTNALTTNLTSFFREQHHFPVLARHLLARRRPEPAIVWCAAASTGEEPYSIAMTACEAFDTLSPPVRVIATDIDTQVLDKARSGIYALDRVESLPPQSARRFFERGTGSNAGLVRVKREVAALVEFRQLNLLEPKWSVRGELAAIFCRNVLIYFDRETQLRVVSRFAPMLEPAGLLFAGHSEHLSYASSLFRLIGKTAYEVVDR